MASLQAFTKSDLLEFTKSNSDKFIILIHGNVYDITKFLNEHPGGEEVLNDVRIIDEFKDSSDDFEDVGHSADSREILKKYLIGTYQA